MKALVLEEYNKLVYKDVPDPEILSNEVLVKVKACGICGSDVHGMDGSTGRRIPPMIMGHEASGIIVKAGADVTGWKSGDRVTFDSTVYPLNDWYTLNGMYNLSDNREVLGVSPGTYKRDGAFAGYISIPQHILYKIPENVTFEQAAMVEAVAVALHSINVSEIKTGDKCVVVGAGMIGIFIVKVLKLSGASKTIAVDINPKRLELAKIAGADHTFLSKEENLVEKINNLTSNRGADISFEAAGKSESVGISIDVLRKGGAAVLVGNVSPWVDFPLQKVVTRELKILGSCAIRGEYEVVLNLLETGKINVDDQISAVAPLSEGAIWFDKLYRKEEDLNKVILVP
ncbi:MAG: galactitol-1-phosphate 5-dehydrogenase [Bacteroidetes bacterium]|nr:MAG: galactitol-1-phosphate 5-dehydrogenase [Bacteroidota bacterium]